MTSTRAEEIVAIPAEYPSGKYLLCFDPLDGASSIDLNTSLGTIFSIVRSPDPARAAQQLDDFLQPGTQQVCGRLCVLWPGDDPRADDWAGGQRLHARPTTSASTS